jgi:hypothetical protein
MTVTASLVIYYPHLRLVGELEDESQETRLSALRASCMNAGRANAYNFKRLR